MRSSSAQLSYLSSVARPHTNTYYTKRAAAVITMRSIKVHLVCVIRGSLPRSSPSSVSRSGCGRPLPNDRPACRKLFVFRLNDGNVPRTGQLRPTNCLEWCHTLYSTSNHGEVQLHTNIHWFSSTMDPPGIARKRCLTDHLLCVLPRHYGAGLMARSCVGLTLTVVTSIDGEGDRI